MGGIIYGVGMLDKGMVHVPGRVPQDDVRFHHTAQNWVQLKTCELLISGILHLIDSDCSWPWITETTESKAVYKGELL